MKKELLILRHGKSDWNISCSDFERPLKKRGKREIKSLALWMTQQKLTPDFIITSPAKRAVETAEKLCKTMKLSVKNIYMDSDIYRADSNALKAVIRKLPQQAQYVLMIGHNPSMENLIIELADNEITIPEDGKLLATATLAHLTLESDFSEVKNNSAMLKSITRGSFLKNN